MHGHPDRTPLPMELVDLAKPLGNYVQHSILYVLNKKTNRRDPVPYLQLYCGVMEFVHTVCIATNILLFHTMQSSRMLIYFLSLHLCILQAKYNIVILSITMDKVQCHKV